MFSGCSEHSGLTENSIILKGLILTEVSGVAGEFFVSNFEKKMDLKKFYVKINEIKLI